MQQKIKRYSTSEKAWEAYQEEKRRKKMQLEEMVRKYKIVLPVASILLIIYYLFIR